jgi:hypothetical protein
MPYRGAELMVDNTRIFGFEIQHIFPTAILTEDSAAALAARKLLAVIGFNTESRGNKIGELITPETANAILNGSAAAKQALLDSGFGLNWHDSQTMAGHPGYNQFIIESLTHLIHCMADSVRDWRVTSTTNLSAIPYGYTVPVCESQLCNE